MPSPFQRKVRLPGYSREHGLESEPSIDSLVHSTMTSHEIDPHPTNLGSTTGKGVQVYRKLQEVSNYDPKLSQQAQDGVVAVFGKLNTASAEEIMRPIQTFVRAFDSLTACHPILQVAAIPFRIIINFEFERRNNDTKIAALKLSMCDMIRITFCLQDHPNKYLHDNHGNFADTPLQSTLKQIAGTLKNCQERLETYANTTTVGRLFHALSWKGTLADFAKKFEVHKTALMQSLAVDTNATITQNYQLTYEVQGSLAKVFDLVSENEKKLKQLVDSVASNASTANAVNIEGIFNNKEKLKTLQTIARDEERVTGSVELTDATSIMSGGGKGGTQSRDEQKAVLKAQMRHEMQSSLEDLLRESQGVFQQKWEARKQLEEAHFEEQRRQMIQLQQSMEDARDQIIDSVNAGPWQKVEDPMVKEIWRTSGWMLSAKNRHFILALHDHFADHHHSAIMQRRRSHSLASSTSSRNDDLGADNKSEDEFWCLEFLEPEYTSIISQAIDTDCSGFIRIREINEFISSKPKGWELLPWLAYIAAGATIETEMYRMKIINKVHQMVSTRDILRVNATAVAGYLDRVNQLLPLLGDDISDISHHLYANSELCRQVSTYMTEKESALAQSLNKLRYQIDQEETVYLVSKLADQGQEFEQFAMPLLYLLISRHYDILRLATKHILNTNELKVAQTSLEVVAKVWQTRTEELMKVYKDQISIQTRFSSHSGGLFLPGYLLIGEKESIVTDMESLLNTVVAPRPFREHVQDDEMDDTEPSLESLHFGVYTEPQRARNKKKEKGVTAKDVPRGRKQGNNAPDASQQETAHARDMQSRKESAINHVGISCDGCGNRIVGPRFKCMQCDDFDLCKSCQESGYLESNHLSTHNWIRLPYIASGITVAMNVKDAWEALEGRIEGQQLEHTFCVDCSMVKGTAEGTVHDDHIIMVANSGCDPSICCDGCDDSIKGTWLSCLECEDVDLCEQCKDWNEPDGTHTRSHAMLKVHWPLKDQELQTYWNDAVKIMAGIPLIRPTFNPGRNTMFAEDIDSDDPYDPDDLVRANDPHDSHDSDPDESDDNDSHDKSDDDDDEEEEDDDDDEYDDDDDSQDASSDHLFSGLDEALGISEDPTPGHTAEPEASQGVRPKQFDKRSLKCMRCNESVQRRDYFRCLDCAGCFLCPKCERKPKTVAKQLTHLAEHVSIWIRRGRRSYEDSDDDEDDDDAEEGSNADGENGDGTDGDGTDERLDRVEEQLDEMRVMIERIAKKMGVMG